MRKLVYLFSSLIILALSFSWLFMQQRLFLTVPTVKQSCLFEINKGDSLDAISQQLVKQNINIKPFWFKVFAYQSHLAHRLKAGEYELLAGSNSLDLLNQFSQGKTHKYSITFPEGWTFKQMLQLINDNTNLEHTLGADKIKDLMQIIVSDQSQAEGWFFPDTYFFEKHSADIDLLKRAHTKMQTVLAEEWLKRAPELPIQTPYQALILASIIEKETAVEEERPLIAGVFSRRLQKGMLLQTDPTVIYGMGDNYRGDIRYQDLHQATPYNTYVNPGLPPTPIAMPGRQAINAALHPDQSNSLYFVGRGDGHHVFSNSLSEHNQAVNRYQR